jgi:Bacterial protein of unknown function (DUF839)
MTKRKLGVLLAGIVAVSAVASAAALAGDNESGFKTSQPSMLKQGDRADVSFEPIITVGDTLRGYKFEALPDGISLLPRGNGRVDLFVNHEASTVPFPYSAPFGNATPASSELNQNDYDNSQVSLLSLNQHSKGVLFGRLAITSNENYQRFCSNYLATSNEGFDRSLFFTNEEAQDWVYRSGTAWPGPNLLPAGTPGAEQTGVVVAYDPKNGKHKTIYGMGRHNHENDVAIPGYDDLVVISGDDTFNTTPRTIGTPPRTTNSWSQLYSYIADDTDAIWNDTGKLYAFRSNGPEDGYYDMTVGSAPISGSFVEVPKEIARGKNEDGAELLSSQFPGMDAPPSGTPDGPQWVLDQWGDTEGVFRFVRIEDVAYDKRPGMSNVVYLADSGRGRRPTDSLDTPFRSTNGRIWKMVLNANDPKIVDSLSILIEGDDMPVQTLSRIHQPDNLETTANGSLLIQEDPGSSQQFAANSTDPNRTEARIWRFDLSAAVSASNPQVVAKVDQSADEGPTDVDGAGTNAPPAKVYGALGAWESSGIVDASSIWGEGWFLVDVQAHTLWVEKARGPDLLAPTGAGAEFNDFRYKREGGQLLAIKIPGA